jgi:hypothetical protein
MVGDGSAAMIFFCAQGRLTSVRCYWLFRFPARNAAFLVRRPWKAVVHEDRCY